MKTAIFIVAALAIACATQSFTSLAGVTFLPTPATLKARSTCISDCGTRCEVRVWTLTAGIVPGATHYEWSWKSKLTHPSPCANQAPHIFTTTSNEATEIYLPAGENTIMVRAMNGTETSAWKTLVSTYHAPNKICP